MQQNTPPVMPVPLALAYWEEVRNALKNFIADIPEEHLRKEVYRHPQAGRFNARQALVVFREHLNHHLPQIKRLLKNFS